ncbi:MFS transporter, DHA1 family, arabinose polymer transporter [Terribacillus saccharophilus]|uniref:MFS transporter, DHA1 family, arabinose polymer transporter n=1 Tax=Terribacillus saccharophilus TaxID=361277 RepID=A0AAX2EDA4_9BACI|nr:MFS transporter, DHA1 family, arabinose polymer transporter [Terribacillus saccharophilus]
MKKYPVSIFILAIGAFAIGMTEFVLMGILPEVAHDLDISISKAGHFVSVYALGVAIGGPIMTLLTLKVPRKRLIILLVLFSIIGNLGSAFAPSYGSLILFRIIASLTHGTYMGACALLATKLVSKELSGRAVSLIFAGLLSSNVFGVPLGTFISQHLSWRYSFGVIVILGVISLLGIIFIVPDQKDKSVFNVKQEIFASFKPQIILALLITFFGFGGMYLVFTYITPILTDISGFNTGSISWLLLIFGVGSTVGSIVGGKLSDWKLMPWLMINIIILVIIMSIFGAVVPFKIWVIPMTFIWGLFAYSLLPTIQTRLVTLASDAPNLASTLTNSAFNISISFAAFFGGIMIEVFSLRQMFFLGAIQSFIGLLVAFMSYGLDKKKNSRLRLNE